MKEGDEAEGAVRLTQGPDCLCRELRFDFSRRDLVKVSGRMVVCVCVCCGGGQHRAGWGDGAGVLLGVQLGTSACMPAHLPTETGQP